MRRTEHSSYIWDRRSEQRDFVGKHKRKGARGRHRCRWEGNIRMDFQEIEWEGIDRINVTQDRESFWAVVNTIMKIRFP
jgi:hypothetical protein